MGGLGDWGTRRLGDEETGGLGDWETGGLGDWETGGLGDWGTRRQFQTPLRSVRAINYQLSTINYQLN